MSRTGDPSPPDELPYSIELWDAGNRETAERVLARAFSGEMAKSIFTAAREEFPERRITLSRHGRIVADSQA